MKLQHILTALLTIAILGTWSCSDDLNTVPLDPTQETSATIFEEEDSYKQFLAKLYAGLALSGQEGPAGRPDISGIDEGFGQYLRGFWNHQELPTDEALIGWNDQTIQDFHELGWTSADGFTFAFYSRIFYQIALCNEFLRETTSDKLGERGVEANLRQEIATFRAEARFLRALSYWHALDLFRNVPFVTEEDPVGAFFPEQISAVDLFSYIEGELLDIQEALPAPRSNEFARADRAAAWMLLAKLYLNAEVYIGEDRYADAFEMSERAIQSGYELDDNYQHLFLTDNDQSDEIIFRIVSDGINTKTYGGMTFIISAAIGGSMDPADLGMAGGWSGTRVTPEFVDQFPESSGGLIVGPNPGETATYRKLYVPGSHQGNDPTQTENSLSAPGGDQIFLGHKFFPDANTEIRFTNIPSNTAPIYGDSDGDGTLEINGDPIIVPEAGLHFIRVDWNAKTYEIERLDWHIAGEAVPGNRSEPLNWDPDLRALVGEFDLVGGTFSFVNSNDEQLGDMEGNGLLQEGESIPNVIEGEGNYRITLFIEQPDYTYQVNSTGFDRRGLFYREGQSKEIEDVSQFTNGIAVTKFKNVSSTGERGSDATFPDTDFPMFRLADAYLMAAEAALRGGGSTSQGLTYLNAVRERAFGGAAGRVSMEEFGLDFILEERARELYWECHRRTDLVRFGQLTDGDYLWQWKGGTMEGQSVSSHRDIFPIPASDINANPKLEQNPGY